MDTHPPSLEPRLRELVSDALALPYVSVSNTDSVETGNHYQSVTLGAERTQGFRSDRRLFLDRVDFDGAKVLDLGSNLGELSRDVRSLGAYLVDGYEYDPFFVELAQALNVLNSTTRVSFFVRDITDPRSYVEPYDIVMAFSVAHYIYPVLARVAAVTRRLLIVETHKLEDNLEQQYIAPVSPYLPAHELLGFSDWSSQREDGQRAVLAFARTDEELRASLRSYRGSESRTDSRSDAGSFPSPDELDARAFHVDVQRTCLQERFFERFRGSSTEEICSDVVNMVLTLPEVAASDDLRLEMYGSPLYWTLYLRGFLEYAMHRELRADNTYLQYMTDYYATEPHDPGLSYLRADNRATRERVAARFDDFRMCRDVRESGKYAADALAPIVVETADTSVSEPLLVYELGERDPIVGTLVDGWHRLFAARISGLKTIPGRVVQVTGGT
jgi:2-polyprenyl-3-methyl-5-hydroxy-6-metoxy-1,4-benzoquinol methylase